MRPGWLILAVALEILSCLGYVVAFLQVFDRAPLRFGARVALSELAFGAAVSLGGAGSIAVGAWLLVERGGEPTRIAERSAVLFLLTSAVNVITLILAGLGLWLGHPARPQQPAAEHRARPPSAPWRSCSSWRCPASASGWRAGRSPGRVRTLLTEVASTIRQTKQVAVHAGLADHRRDRLPMVRHRRARRVLRRRGRRASAGDSGARLPDRLPLQPDPGPGQHRRARRQPGRHVRPLRNPRHARHRGHRRLPRDRPVDPGDVGHGRVPHPPAHPGRAPHPATPACRSPAQRRDRPADSAPVDESGGRSNVPVDVARRRDRRRHVFGGSLWIDTVNRAPQSGPKAGRGRLRSNEASLRTASGVDGDSVQQQSPWAVAVAVRAQRTPNGRRDRVRLSAQGGQSHQSSEQGPVDHASPATGFTTDDRGSADPRRRSADQGPVAGGLESGEIDPSYVNVPKAGCWRLTRTGPDIRIRSTFATGPRARRYLGRWMRWDHRRSSFPIG